MHSLVDLVFSCALLAVVLLAPALAIADHRRLERDLARNRRDARIRSFATGIALQWATAGALLAGWWFTSYDADAVFLVPGWTGAQWVAVAVGLAMSGLMVAQTVLLRGRDAKLADVRDKIGVLIAWAPRDRREQRWFDGISLTAGVCEELIYRGLLLGALASWIGLWPAVLVSTVLFGVAHAYQGVGGASRTAVFGVIAALLTVSSGSVYLAMVVHAVIDLAQGRLLAMAARGAESGPQAVGPLADRPA